MSDPTIQDRVAGAIMGAFIGDALGLGPHWYYDLAALRRDYGDWITTYADPKPGRYHSGLKAGQLSQNGVILRLMLRSLVERGSYDEADFCRRMDEEIFPSLNGMPVNGPGGYTQQSIRDAWRKRVQQNLPWGQTGAKPIPPRRSRAPWRSRSATPFNLRNSHPPSPAIHGLPRSTIPWLP